MKKLLLSALFFVAALTACSDDNSSSSSFEEVIKQIAFDKTTNTATIIVENGECLLIDNRFIYNSKADTLIMNFKLNEDSSALLLTMFDFNDEDSESYTEKLENVNNNTSIYGEWYMGVFTMTISSSGVKFKINDSKISSNILHSGFIEELMNVIKYEENLYPYYAFDEYYLNEEIDLYSGFTYQQIDSSNAVLNFMGQAFSISNAKAYEQGRSEYVNVTIASNNKSCFLQYERNAMITKDLCKESNRDFFEIDEEYYDNIGYVDAYSNSNTKEFTECLIALKDSTLFTDDTEVDAPTDSYNFLIKKANISSDAQAKKVKRQTMQKIQKLLLNIAE